MEKFLIFHNILIFPERMKFLEISGRRSRSGHTMLYMLTKYGDLANNRRVGRFSYCRYKGSSFAYDFHSNSTIFA